MTLPIHIAFDGLSGVDGSARFSFESTTAIASVSGPIAARLATEHPARATIDLHVRPLSSVPGTTEKHAGIALKGILERACILAQHPRTLIQVVVQALSPCSSSRSSMDAGVDVDVDVLLAAEINACSLALLNAGSIPMRGVICAIAVAQPTSASQPQVVTASGGGSHPEHAGCFAFLFGIDQTHTSNGGNVIPPSRMIWTNYRASPGKTFSVAALAGAEKLALEGATAVWMKIKESMRVLPFVGDGLS